MPAFVLIPLSKQQCWLSLSLIIRCRRAAYHHRGACIATQTLLQDARQLAVTIRNICLQNTATKHNTFTLWICLQI